MRTKYATPCTKLRLFFLPTIMFITLIECGTPFAIYRTEPAEDMKMKTKNEKLEIQKHAKVSDFIGHNDMTEKTAEEKEAALVLYNTKKWEAEQNGVKAVYVAAFTLNGEFIGGICWAGDKVYGHSNTEKQHEEFINWF